MSSDATTKAMENGKCPFCDLIAASDKGETFVAAFESGQLYLHPNQAYPGRCIFVCKEHAGDLTGLDPDLFTEYNAEMLHVSKVLKGLFHPDLMNICSLGNHVEHVHYHIIPRYKDDGNWGDPPWPSQKTVTLSEDERAERIGAIREGLANRD